MTVKKYGETTSEKVSLENFKCRQIVSEIMKFGVNEDQVIQIIKLLSLELENRNSMLVINEACKKINDGQIFTESSKIIT
jgi:hypothetical protein